MIVDDAGWSRRTLLASGAAAAFLSGCAGAPPPTPQPAFQALEARLGGGRLGLVARDLATGRRVEHRAHERFAMCSTFKWVLGGLVLQRVEHGALRLDDAVAYNQADLVAHSPFTGPRLNERRPATVGELCGATIATSDNTAANLLLRAIGGPAGFTAGVRALGDSVTRLDRWETALNENAPGDPRDTTTPEAMAELMRALLFGRVLADTSGDLLRGWMEAATTGLDRLRGGLPSGWIAGDKTGTGSNGANSDVAFTLVPGPKRRPLVIASYIDAPQVGLPEQNSVHRALAMQAVAMLRT